MGILDPAGLRWPGVIRWENPPNDEPEFATALRAHPGQWAVVHEGTVADWDMSPDARWLRQRPDDYDLIWKPRKQSRSYTVNGLRYLLGVPEHGTAYACYLRRVDRNPGDEQ